MTTSEKVIKNKLGLLKLSQQLGNVSRCLQLVVNFWTRFKAKHIAVT